MEERNINLIVFTVNILDVNSNYDYGVVYNFITENRLDGLIAVTTALYSDETNRKMVHRIFEELGIPMVSLAIEIPGIPSIVIDGASGIKHTKSHGITF